jgi:hypothetical protein
MHISEGDDALNGAADIMADLALIAEGKIPPHWKAFWPSLEVDPPEQFSA